MNRIGFAGLVVSALLVALPAAASHNFDDVPSSHPHHDAIDWMVQKGITAGCDADSFCPGDPVTRGQLATFLQRYDGGQQSSVPQVQVVRSESQYATCPAGTSLVGGGFVGNREAPPFASFPNGDRWEVWADLGTAVYAMCLSQ